MADELGQAAGGPRAGGAELMKAEPTATVGIGKGATAVLPVNRTGAAAN
jgi:hypothetical protein